MVSSLLAPLTPDQQRLLELIGRVYVEHKQWPIWQYLDEELRKSGLDARAVLQSLPVVGENRVHGRHYGLIWFDRLNLNRDSIIRLTVAGTHFVPELAGFGQLFIDVLAFLAETRRTIPLSPIEVTTMDIKRRNIARHLRVLDDVDLDLIPGMLEIEPPTMGGSSGKSIEGEWYRELTSELLEYAAITSVPEYVARVAELYTPSAPVSPKSVPSPLDLVASFDYFNTVWRLHFKAPIVQIFNAERMARLAFGAGSADEFSSQISSVAELLKNLRVSGSQEDGKTQYPVTGLGHVRL